MRTSNGSVVQFLYGEDGMDGTAIEAQKLESLRMSPNKFRVRPRLPCPRSLPFPQGLQPPHWSARHTLVHDCTGMNEEWPAVSKRQR